MNRIRLKAYRFSIALKKRVLVPGCDKQEQRLSGNPYPRVFGRGFQPRHLSQIRGKVSRDERGVHYILPAHYNSDYLYDNDPGGETDHYH
jgi:hypothetical protein